MKNQSEFSQFFLNGMRDRMLTSFHKYGALADNIERCNCFKEMRRRIKKYRETGNIEWLMDAANFLMMEFMYPKHKKACFRATGSHESPGMSHLTVNEEATWKRKQ